MQLIWTFVVRNAINTVTLFDAIFIHKIEHSMQTDQINRNVSLNLTLLDHHQFTVVSMKRLQIKFYCNVSGNCNGVRRANE